VSFSWAYWQNLLTQQASFTWLPDNEPCVSFQYPVVFMFLYSAMFF
jgi:hypothetical protein